MAAHLAPDRVLGRTGVRVPLIAYGTAPLGKPQVTREHAVRCLNHAIDLGITYLDTSPDYGSEPHVGTVMASRRNEVFLATKINNRSREGVLQELESSLQRLQTDHVDLIQVHAVNAFADLEQALAQDGALAALEEARRAGKVRFIGITGHARPEVLAHALRHYEFDTLLMALGAVDRLVSAPEIVTLPLAAEQGVGVIAMKVFGHGELKRRDLALRYCLGLPGVHVAVVGLKNEAEIDEVVANAAEVSPLNGDELDVLIEEAKPLVIKDAEESQKGESKLFWLHDTTVMGWKQQDEPAMVAY